MCNVPRKASLSQDIACRTWRRHRVSHNICTWSYREVDARKGCSVLFVLFVRIAIAQTCITFCFGLHDCECVCETSAFAGPEHRKCDGQSSCGECDWEYHHKQLRTWLLVDADSKLDTWQQDGCTTLEPFGEPFVYIDEWNHNAFLPDSVFDVPLFADAQITSAKTS